MEKVIPEIWILESLSVIPRAQTTTKGIGGGGEVGEGKGEEFNESRDKGIGKITYLDIKSTNIYEESFFLGGWYSDPCAILFKY